MSRPLLRRLLVPALAATLATTGAVPFLASPAAAEATGGSVSPASSINSDAASTTGEGTRLTYTAPADADFPVGSGTVNVIVSRTGAPSDVLPEPSQAVATVPPTVPPGGPTNDTVSQAVVLNRANPGTYDITVRAPAGTAQVPPTVYATCVACFTIIAFTPSCSSFVRQSGARFFVNGDSLPKGLTLGFLKPGETDPTIVSNVDTGVTAAKTTGNPNVDTERQMNFDLATADAIGGAHRVFIRDSAGQFTLCPQSFTVPRGVLVADAVPGRSRPHVGVNSEKVPFTITNPVGVLPETTVSFASTLGNNANVQGVTATPGALDGAGLHLLLSVTGNADTDSYARDGGERVVTFTNPDGGFFRNAALLEVTDQPGVDDDGDLGTAPSRSTVGQGATDVPVVITVPERLDTTFIERYGYSYDGAGLMASLGDVPGLSLKFASFVGTPDANGNFRQARILVSTLTTLADGTEVRPVVDTYTLSTLNKSGGRSSTRASSPDFATGSCLDCFAVARGPIVTGVTPNDLSPGATNATLTITGTGFQPDETGSNPPPRAVVTLPPQFTIVGRPSATATTITATVNVSPTATSSNVPVTVTNPGNLGTDTCDNCLTIAGLAVGAVTPAQPTNDGVKRLTIPGGPFTDGTTVTLERAGQASVPGTVVTTSLNQIVADFDLLLASPGTGWSMRVVTPAGQTGRRQNAIEILSPTPVLTSVAPNTASQGGTVDVAVVGDFFAKGSLLEFAIPGNPPGQIVNGVTSLGSTVTGRKSMVVKVRVAANATPGARNVTVRNTDGRGSLNTVPVTFTVRQSPTATSMMPSSRAAGSAQFTATISGSNFIAASKVEVAGGGVTVGTPTTNDTGTSVSAPMTIAADAATGARNVIVTNQDGSQAACSGCLTITAAPTISSVSPAVLRRGSNGTSITITGTGFSANPSTPTVTFGPGVTTAGNASSTATTVTVPVNVSPTAARGPVSVTVTNPDSSGAGRVTCDACLKLADLPTAPSITTATPADRQVTLAWTAPTDDGGSPVTGYAVQVINSGSEPNGTVTISGTTATITGLTNGTLYGFTVTATNAVGSSVPSDGRTATPGKVPAAPTGVAAQPGNGEVSVSWTAPDNGGSQITKYTITATPGGATQVVTGTPAATSGTVTGLTNGTAYTFTVVATNGFGDGPASAPSTAVTPTDGRPAAPTAVVATVDRAPGTADLSWTAPSGTITSYRVEVTPAAGTVTYPANRAATTAVVTGLANGTAYSFRVFATTAGGEGAGSTATAPVTPYDVPGAPTALAGSGDGGNLTVTWTAPAANGRPITSYTLVLTPAEGTITYPTDRSQTGATVTGLTPGTDYAASVVATNARGTGAAGTATMRSNVTTSQGRFVGLPTPVRAMDSRPSSNVGTAPGAKRGPVTLDLSSRIPATATGAVLNVTVTAPDRGGFVVVYPFGAAKPPTSNVNFAAGQTQANEVVTALTDRKATVFVDTTGSTQLIVDVVGYFTSETGSPGYLVPTTPKRVLGEALARNVGSSAGSSSVDVDLSSALPAGATGAVLNVTVASPTESGFVVAYPSGTTQPGTSNVNFGANQVQANEVVTLLGTGNKVRLTLSRGQARLIVDVVGAIVPSTATGAKRFTALPAPVRALDTRDGTGTTGTARRSASSPVELTLPAAVPADATGVILNVTSTSQLRSGYVVVFPTGTTMPGTSNVNFRQGVNQANEVLVGIGTGRKVTLAVGGGANPESHVIADVVGYLR